MTLSYPEKLREIERACSSFATCDLSGCPMREECKLGSVKNEIDVIYKRLVRS